MLSRTSAQTPRARGNRIMTSPMAGGVDCDLHPAVPHLTSLLPYLNDYWRDQVTTRGVTDLVSQSYPSNSPISARPDWRPAKGKPCGHAGAGACPLRGQLRHLQPVVWRADGLLRGHGRCLLPGAERLAGEGVARQGCSLARLDRDSRPEH